MGIIIFEASTFWTGTPTGISLIVLWKEIQGIRRQLVFVAVGRSDEAGTSFAQLRPRQVDMAQLIRSPFAAAALPNDGKTIPLALRPDE